ncbi:sulfotransferase domain-containing protein [uncultured Draconibacterium sp.]|uniref:sulfotransferase domain-containing protein n=1 Tax=uncultured Draconibacterium sp. TaxID=1573823 RepID=UPI003260203D
MKNFPNIYIIGTAKAATSSLADYLNLYNEVCIGSLKEPHYWSENFPTSRLKILITEKKAHKYLKAYNSTCENRIDASTSYICSHHASKNIGKMEAVKIILIVRDPVDRYISHYRNDYSSGVETRSLKHTIFMETNGEVEKYSYFDYGRYFTHLKRWTKSVKENSILCLDYDTLIKSPEKVLNEIMNFLEIEYNPCFIFPKNNQAFIPRNKLWMKFMQMHKVRMIVRSVMPQCLKILLRNRFIYRLGKNVITEEDECRVMLLKRYNTEIKNFAKLVKEVSSIGEFKFMEKYD